MNNLFFIVDKVLFLFNCMGNFCSEADNAQPDTTGLRRKRKTTASTKSNQLGESDNNPEEVGLNSFEIIDILKSNNRVSRRVDCPDIGHVQVISQLGKGAQAQVYKVNVQSKDPRRRYSMSGKNSLIAIKRINIGHQLKNSQSIELARSLLIQNDCPFLVKGMFICQNDKYVYEGMNLAEGGDLSSFLETTTGKGDAFRRLGELGVRMVVAGVVLGIEYMHKRGLIYCDLKTDNVLIGIDGYPMLADFELAKKETNIPVSAYEGTLTYAGPELYTKDSFNKSIDLWALGILTYTLVYNQPPYRMEEVLDTDFVEECMAKQGKYRLKRKKVSQELNSFINKLLKVEPNSRLGYNSWQEVKNHPFFHNFNWQLYSSKKLPNPIVQIVNKFNKNKLATSQQY